MWSQSLVGELRPHMPRSNYWTHVPELKNLCIATKDPHAATKTQCCKIKKKKKKAHLYVIVGASLVAQLVKNLPAVQETQVRSLGQEDSPAEGNGKPLQYYCLKNHGQRSLAVINNMFVSSCVSGKMATITLGHKPPWMHWLKTNHLLLLTHLLLHMFAVGQLI